MHRQLCIALLVVPTSVVAGAQTDSGGAEELTADQILGQVREKYASLPAYRDTGTYSKTITVEDKSKQQSAEFSNLFVRPGYYRFEYRGDDGHEWFILRPDSAFYVHKYRDRVEEEWEYKEREVSRNSVFDNIIHNTPFVDSEGHVLCLLLPSECPDEHSSFLRPLSLFAEADVLSREADEELDGTQCFVIRIDEVGANSGHATLWVDKSTLLIRRMEKMIEPEDVSLGVRARLELDHSVPSQAEMDELRKLITQPPDYGSAEPASADEPEEPADLLTMPIEESRDEPLPPQIAEILDQVRKTYTELPAYRGTGTMNETTTMLGETQEDSASFTNLFVRPDLYRYEFTSDQSKRVFVMDGASAINYLSFGPGKREEREEIARSEIFSDFGYTPFVATTGHLFCLLLPDECPSPNHATGATPIEGLDLHEKVWHEESELDGTPCHIIATNRTSSEYGDVEERTKLWVDKDRHFIRRLQYHVKRKNDMFSFEMDKEWIWNPNLPGDGELEDLRKAITAPVHALQP